MKISIGTRQYTLDWQFHAGVPKAHRQADSERNAVGVDQQVVLGATFAAIHWAWPGFLPAAGRTNRARVDHGTRPVDRVGVPKAREQDLMEAIPHAGFVPVAEPSPARHAADAHLGRDVLPRDAGLEYEDDAGERLAVIGRLAPGVSKPPRLGRRQQRSDNLPELVIHKRLGHVRTSNTEFSRPMGFATAAPLTSFC